MPIGKTYILKLTPRFIADVIDAVQYISVELQNAEAAEKLSGRLKSFYRNA